jgi:hypothetical protein
MADLLAIYLQDHLAAATAGRDLARRTLGANRGSEFEPFLARRAAAIDEDRQELQAILGRLGVRPDPVKLGAAWLGEKAGRLKFNGQLSGYSPLSRLVELEGLTVGVSAKLSLWQMLAVAGPERPALADAPLERLIERAEGQLDELKGQRARAAELVIGLAQT